MKRKLVLRLFLPASILYMQKKMQRKYRMRLQKTASTTHGRRTRKVYQVQERSAQWKTDGSI